MISQIQSDPVGYGIFGECPQNNITIFYIVKHIRLSIEPAFRPLASPSVRRPPLSGRVR